jgi:outer membrane lipoprotein-sorting protein
MDRLKKGLVLILTGFFCLALFRPVFGQETTGAVVPAVKQTMTVEQLTAAMGQKWSSVKDLQVDMTINMQMLGRNMNMEGTVWQKDKLFRMEMTLPADIMPQTGKTAEPIKMLMVFDGKTMWQSMPMMNMVTKTDFSVLGDKAKDMFLKSSAPGSLPPLSYKLSEDNRDGIGYYLLESEDVNKFIEGNPSFAMAPNMSFESMSIWVDKATLFPDLLEFYSKGVKPVMSIGFKNVKTDQNLSPDLFVFKIPEGAQVMDMTKAMKGTYENMGKAPEKQLTAPDTTQAPAAPTKAAPRNISEQTEPGLPPPPGRK